MNNNNKNVPDNIVNKCKLAVGGYCRKYWEINKINECINETIPDDNNTIICLNSTCKYVTEHDISNGYKELTCCDKKCHINIKDYLNGKILCENNK